MWANVLRGGDCEIMNKLKIRDEKSLEKVGSKYALNVLGIVKIYEYKNDKQFLNNLNATLVILLI